MIFQSVNIPPLRRDIFCWQFKINRYMLNLLQMFISCVSCLAKMQKDKTLWYSGVLPQADALCLFEDADGKYLISTLNGTPSADFSKIKRWIYLKDLENL